MFCVCVLLFSSLFLVDLFDQVCMCDRLLHCNWPLYQNTDNSSLTNHLSVWALFVLVISQMQMSIFVQ